MALTTIARCLVCHASGSTLLYPSTYRLGVDEAHDYFLAQRKFTARGDIRRCTGCGFIFTSPQFEPADYDRIYSRIGGAAADDSGPGQAAVAARYARLKRAVLEHADPAAPYLDFGCGSGDFLLAMGNPGTPAGTGFEIGAPGQRAGPGGQRIVSGLWPEVAGSAALAFASQQFITAFDVFEHLPQLERDLDLIRQVLRPRGHLFVTVPDAGSTMARVAGSRWNMLLLEHLWYFNATTLDRLMLRHGFESVGHKAVPYDAALAHVAKRLGETLGLRLPTLPRWLRQWVLPVPAGVLFAAYRRLD